MEAGKGMDVRRLSQERAHAGNAGGEKDGRNPFEVEIPQEHPLYYLAQMGREENQRGLVLDLSPGERGAGLLMPQQMEAEGKQLLSTLRFAAQRRLRQALPVPHTGILQDLDEMAIIYLSRDKMLAWLLLLPPIGAGKPLSLVQLEIQLANRGLVCGVDHSLIQQLPTLEDRHFRLFPIAVGRVPQRGQDGYVEDRYPREDLMGKPETGEERVDYALLSKGKRVEKDEIICEMIPPTPGIPGMTVTGERVAPLEDGDPAVAPKGRSTRVSEDGRYLLADQAGRLAFSGRTFMVRSVLEIFESLDPAESHNINFFGDIVIHGDVCRGASIRAMGDVQIDGVVEAASVEAGEYIFVSGGVQGQDCAVLQAHRGVFVKYLERCTVLAKEIIQAECIIESRLYCNGDVYVNAGRGVIIGGEIRCAKMVNAKTVGSRAEPITSIVLGGHPCEELEQIQIEKEMDTVKQEISKVSSKADGPEKDRVLSKLRMTLTVGKMKMERFEKELSQCCTYRYGQDPRRLVCQTAYRGTTVNIGEHTYLVEHKETECVIGLKDTGKIGRLHWDR